MCSPHRRQPFLNGNVIKPYPINPPLVTNRNKSPILNRLPFNRFTFCYPPSSFISSVSPNFRRRNDNPLNSLRTLVIFLSYAFIRKRNLLYDEVDERIMEM